MRTYIFLLLILSAFLLPAQNSWVKKENFPGAKRSRSVAFSIGNRGYIACGEDSNDVECNDLWEYDPGTDSWMQKANLPAAGRRDAVGFAIGNKGYLGTGIDAPDSWIGNNYNDWWEYDPVTNTWTQKANYPGSTSFGGIYFGVGFVVNGRGYICGGKQSASNYTSALWEYNPANNQWTQKTSFPGGTRYAMSAFSVGNKGYCGLGTDENILQTDWWEYNPSSNSWVQKASFPGSGRFAASGFSIGMKGYILCGADGGYKDELWQYDVVSDSWWVKAPFGGGPRRSVPVFVLGNAAYAGTGKGYTGSRRDFWQYEQYVTSVEEENAAVIDVYPNPVSDVVIIQSVGSSGLFAEDTRITLYDLKGSTVRSISAMSVHKIAIDVSDLTAGVYLLSITGGDQITNTRIVIQ